MSNSLDMVVDVRHTTIFFRKSDCGQYYICLLSCLCKQYILHY